MPSAGVCTLPENRKNRVDETCLQALEGYQSSKSYLLEDEIPQRVGDRPDCESCLPHAQMNQQSSDDVFKYLKERALEQMTSNDDVKIGKSTVSMPSTFPAFHLICHACNDSNNSNPEVSVSSKTIPGMKMPEEACMTPGGPTCGTEFAHIHTRYYPSDSLFAKEQTSKARRWQEWQGGGQGSMHMCLTLKDAALVLQRGWGERHLLAGNSESVGFNVPSGLVLIYAPRTIEESNICMKFLYASKSFAKSL